MILIEKVQPSADLTGLVKEFIINETTDFFTAQAVPPWTKKIITFQYRDQVNIRHRQTESATYEINIHGNVMEPYWFLPVQGHIGIFSVEFTEIGFYHFLREDVRQFNKGIFSLADIFPTKDLQHICSALHDEPTISQKVSIVEVFLRNRFNLPRSRKFEDIAHICSALEGNHPQILRKLAGEVGFTERHLRRKFHQVTGLAPKKYMQVQRMNRALFQKIEDPHADWATIAYSAGYADQAHLTRDFSANMGILPTQVRLGELQMSRIYR